jgi:hypothetical protein
LNDGLVVPGALVASIAGKPAAKGANTRLMLPGGYICDSLCYSFYQQLAIGGSHFEIIHGNMV